VRKWLFAHRNFPNTVLLHRLCNACAITMHTHSLAIISVRESGKASRIGKSSLSRLQIHLR
jgi:hypothetical protein